MDHAKESLAIFDESHARHYRDGDVAATATGSRRHYGDMLTHLTESFDRPLTVLDVGCGSGRYFHCLRNVRKLVGIDISPHMLEHARRPVNGAALDIREIELRCGDVRALGLDVQSFDLIYSIGVLAEYSPLDAALLDRLFTLLKPGGRLFFTAVDTRSRLKMPENARPSLARRALRKAFPLLPPWGRQVANRALAAPYVTNEQLEHLMRAAPFERFTITPYEHPSGWNGVHLDCLASRANA